MKSPKQEVVIAGPSSTFVAESKADDAKFLGVERFLDMAHVVETPWCVGVLCEECGGHTAACVCEACDELLCSKCCALVHPRRADGSEHAHFVALAIRNVLETDGTGAIQGARNGSVAAGLFARDGLEMTEEELEAAGVDLSRPRTLEAPRINLCAGDVDSSPATRTFRAGEVVIFLDRDEVDGDGVIERWGVIHRVPPRTLRDRVDHAGVAAVANASGERSYQVRRFDGSASCDYAAEARAAVIEEKMHRDEMVERYKRRSGLYDAALLGFASSLNLPRVGPRREPLRVPDAAPVVTVAEGDIFRPRDRRRLLLDSRSLACRRVLVSAERRATRIATADWLSRWASRVRDTAREERWHAASRIARAWRRKQRQGLEAAFNRAIRDKVLARRHGLTSSRRRFQPIVYLTDDEKRHHYSLDHKLFFRTRKELEDYADALRDIGQLVCEKMLARAAANKNFAFVKWRDVWLALVEIDKAPIAHIDKFDDEDERHSRSPETAFSSPPSPWHPAVGVKLSALPELWSRPLAKEGRREIDDAAKFNSMRAAMRGPTDVSNWVVPNLLLIGPHPTGPAQLADSSQKEDDIAGAGIALVQAGVSVFVDLCPESESRIIAETLGAPWSRLEEEEGKGRRDKNDGGGARGDRPSFALRAILKKVHVRASGQLAKAESARAAARNEVQVCPRYGERDLRYADAERKLFIALAKERMMIHDANKARRALNKLPTHLEILRFPIEDEDCGEDDAILKICEAIEAKMRAGHCVYVYSRLGHGRAGMLAALLLGRLYGISAIEALDRAQIYHDSRRCFTLRHKNLAATTGTNDNFVPHAETTIDARPISCPQTLRQISAVHRLLAHTDTIYAEHCMRGRWPSQTRFQRLCRGQPGVPRPLAPTLAPQDTRSPFATDHGADDENRHSDPATDHDRLPEVHSSLRGAAAARWPSTGPSTATNARPAIIRRPTLRTLRPPSVHAECLGPKVTPHLLPRFYP